MRARYGRYRRTRLHWAAWKGKSARVAQLLTWKSNTEAADSEGVTPLILASSFTESADTVVELLRRGANIHATAATGITALHMAAICGSPLAMRELLARGAKVDSPASNERLTPLHNACQQGCVDSVRLLLDAGSDAAGVASTCSPLFLACQESKPRVVELLLARPEVRAALDRRLAGGVTALNIAADRGCVPAVRALLAAGADVHALNDERVSALHFAAQEGRVTAMLELIDAGASVNGQTSRRVTPLMMACARGHLAAVAVLIRAGASVNARDINGATALVRVANLLDLAAPAEATPEAVLAQWSELATLMTTRGATI